MLDFLFLCLYFSITARLFWIDLFSFVLPNTMTYSLLFSGIGYSIIQGQFFDHGMAVLCGSGVFLLIRVLTCWIYKREAMGAGDVKLAAGIGAYWGLTHILYSIYISFILGGLIALIVLLLTDKKKTDYIPFGPILIASSWGFYVVF